MTDISFDNEYDECYIPMNEISFFGLETQFNLINFTTSAINEIYARIVGVTKEEN